jgi:arylsulfatase A-like enzyme
MNIKHFFAATFNSFYMKNLFSIGLLVVLYPLSIFSQKTSTKPNIVFILSDDLSFKDLSAFGQKNYSTPHIDALASQSVRFTQAYAGAPECAPARATLLTSLHVGHAPIRLNSSARGFEPLPEGTQNFAKMLQKAGYKTGVIGKWGLGLDISSGNPLKQGFDYHFGYLSHYEAHSYFPRVLYENNQRIPYPTNNGFDISVLQNRDRGIGKKEDFYNADGKLTYVDINKAVYTPDVLDEKAKAFIDKNKANPFFLFFTTNLPHGPTIVDDLRQLSQRKDMSIASKEWGAMVQRLDISIGKLIENLKNAGVYDNTLIVFASDNGYSMHSPSKNANGERIWKDDEHLKNKGIFRGGKFGVLEGGMRIPFFVHFPKQTEPKTVSTPVWLLDLYPTFAEISKSIKPKNIDGYSLIPLINGNKNTIPESRFMYFYKEKEQAIRQGAWFAFRETPQSPIQLYLVEEDPVLSNDVSKIYPSVSAQLKRLMDTVHTPHEWYFNPTDTEESFAKKVALARQTNQRLPEYRPNGLDKMPWEK